MRAGKPSPCGSSRLAAPLGLCAALLGCTQAGPAPHADAGSAVPATALRHIVVTARQFRFEPDIIELVEQEEVLLELRSLDRTHGFAIFALGISVQILPERPTLLRLKPPRAGTFTFACSVECGSGHEEMTGALVVKPGR
jgi:cytochrome c oxidase subunit 2